MGSRFNYSSPVASGGQQYQTVDNRHVYINEYMANQTSDCYVTDPNGEWLNSNSLASAASRPLDGNKPDRANNNQNVAISIANGGYTNTLTNSATNYLPESLVKCSNCDSGILLSNAFKVDSSAFCDACCYSEKMKVSQILLCIYCRRLFVLSSREAKTHGKFHICSPSCHQKFTLEYPFCCLGCGEFFHHLPILSRTISPSQKVPQCFSYCSSKCHDEIENQRSCCVCGSTYYEVPLGTIILPDGRAKYCCSDNGECKSTFEYCLGNTCAYCSEVPRAQNPLRLKFVYNKTMIFCEAACLRGYLDCRVQRPPKSSSDGFSIKVSQNNQNPAAVAVNTQAQVQSALVSSSQVQPSAVGHSIQGVGDGRSSQGVNTMETPVTNNYLAYNSVHTNELQNMVSRLGFDPNSDRMHTTTSVASLSAERVESNPNTVGSTIVIGPSLQSAALNHSQVRSVQHLTNDNALMRQAATQQSMGDQDDDDDEDIQVINVIKETSIPVTTKENVQQPTNTVSAARTQSLAVSTQPQRPPSPVAEADKPEDSAGKEKQSQNLFELLDAPVDDSSQPAAQPDVPPNIFVDKKQGSRGNNEIGTETGLPLDDNQVGPNKAESEKRDSGKETRAEPEKSVVSTTRGSTSVVSEQSCYTVESAYKDIVLQSCASEPASDLSQVREAEFAIGGLDTSPSGVRNGAKLVACHACARSVATFEAYPSFCTGVQKSVNQLFCSRTCRRKFQERFGIKKKCTMCSIERPVEEEVQIACDRKMAFCSTLCCYLFKEHYFRNVGLIFSTCSFCGRNFSDSKDGKLVFTTATEKYRFCCNKCKDNFRQWNLASRCDACLRNITSGEVKIFWRGRPKQFCDRKCMLTFYQQENSSVNEPFYGSETFKNSLKLPLLTPSLRRPLKVKRRHVAIHCHPQHSNRMIQVAPRMRDRGSSMDDNDLPGSELDAAKFTSYPLIIPVPVPIYFPVPCQLYSQPCPYPVPLPLPCAVPVAVPEKVLFSKDLQQPEATAENDETISDSFLIGRAIAASLVRDEEPDFRSVKQENDVAVNDYIDKLKALDFNFDQEFDSVLHASENSDLSLALDSKIEFLRSAFKLDSCLEWIKTKLIEGSNLASDWSYERGSSISYCNKNRLKSSSSLKRQHKMMSSNENRTPGANLSKVSKVLHNSSDNEESESESESLASIQSLERGLRKQIRVDYKSMIDGAESRKSKTSNGASTTISACGEVDKSLSAIKVEKNSASSDDDATPLKLVIKTKEISSKDTPKTVCKELKVEYKKHSSTKSCLTTTSQGSPKLKHLGSSSKRRKKLLQKAANNLNSSGKSAGSESSKQPAKNASGNKWTPREVMSWTTKCCNCLIYTLGYIGKMALVNNLACDNLVNHNAAKSILEIENISDSCLDQILCLFMTSASGGQKTTALEERSLTLRLLSLLFLQLFLNFFKRPKLLFFHRSYPFFQQTLCEVRIPPVTTGDPGKMDNLKILARELCWVSGLLGDSNAHSLQFTVLYHLFGHMKLTSLSQHKLLTKSHFSRSLSNDVIRSGKVDASLPVSSNAPIVEAIKFRNHGTLNFSDERKMSSDPTNPMRCPMKAYNMYLSKLPANSVSLTVSLFYKEPYITYTQNSRLWFCNSRLNEKTLSLYLVLARVCSPDSS